MGFLWSSGPAPRGPVACAFVGPRPGPPREPPAIRQSSDGPRLPSGVLACAALAGAAASRRAHAKTAMATRRGTEARRVRADARVPLEPPEPERRATLEDGRALLGQLAEGVGELGHLAASRLGLAEPAPWPEGGRGKRAPKRPPRPRKQEDSPQRLAVVQARVVEKLTARLQEALADGIEAKAQLKAIEENLGGAAPAQPPELEALRARLEEVLREKAAVEAEKADLAAQVAAAQQKAPGAPAADKDVRKLQADLKSLREEREELRRQRDDAVRKLEESSSSSSEVEDMRVSLEKARKAKDAALAQLESIKAERETDLKLFDEHLAALQTSVEQAQEPWWRRIWRRRPRPDADGAAAEPSFER